MIFKIYNNSSLITAARLGQAAGRRGHMPRIFGYLSIEQRLPVCAILFNTFLSMLFIFPEGATFSNLVNYTGFTVWLIYGAEFLGVIVFRFRKNTKDLNRPYKVPLPIAGFCFCVALFMTLTPIISDPA